MDQLELLQSLIEASRQVAGDPAGREGIDGVLCRVVDAARAVTGARLGLAGYGFDGRRFRFVAAAPDGASAQPCLPGDGLAEAVGSVLAEMPAGGRALLLTQADLVAHPAWSVLLGAWAPARRATAADAGAAPAPGAIPGTLILGAPLAGPGGPADGLVLVSDRAQGEFNVADELLLAQLATVSGLALQHAQDVAGAAPPPALPPEPEPRAGEELLLQLAENVNEVLWVADQDRRRVLYINPAYERIWLQSRAGLYERPEPFLDAVFPLGGDGLPAASLTPGGDVSRRFRLTRPDGSERWIAARVFPLTDALGLPQFIAGVAEDVTEQTRSYQVLEQRVNERTRELSTLLAVSHQMASVLEVKPLLARILDELAKIVDFTTATIYRLSEDAAAVQVLDYRGPLPREQVVELSFPIADTVGLEEVVARREPVIIADTWDDSPLSRAWRASPHAVQRWLVGTARSWMAVPLRLEDRLIGMLRLGHQLPNRFAEGHAELALAFADHAAVAMENARLYEQVQALAVVEERQRLARDLHDAVSQTLFSASLIADVLPRVWQQDQAHGQELLNELQHLARGALGEMRTLLFELRPGALVDVEMAELFRHLVDAAVSHAGVPISLIVDAHCPIPSDVQIALYRITQEALNNVVKHAQAHAAAVTLHCGPAGTDGGPGTLRVELEIADDGRGFTPDAAHGGSFGLSNMEERAAAIGAALDVRSAPGQGTRVRAVWVAP